MRLNPDQLLTILQSTICSSVRADEPDLSARQLAILLIIGSEKEMHTVRGLATRMNISKPAISRSLDRLCKLLLAQRADDPRDRRSVLVIPTKAGMRHVISLRTSMAEAILPRMRAFQRYPTRNHAAFFAAE
jgi:DNA-binding MarR family transcriptional regulator